MAESFDIILSKRLAPGDFIAVLAEMIPLGLQIDVGRDIGELPKSVGAIWALVGLTADPDWPFVFNCLVCADECGLGRYPDLRVAARLYHRFGVNSLCGTYAFAGELDPHDPYWSLACVSGSWYLASTSGTALMGPYTDGVQSIAGNEPVRLVRRVEIPEAVFA